MIRSTAGLLLLLFAFALLVTGVSAQEAVTKTHKDFPDVPIRNFGQMDERFYRGGQPKEDEFKYLKEMGIRTVINMRNDPKPWEQAIVESLGMRYVHIPLSDKKTPPEGTAEKFLEIVNDPDTGKFFVHCRGGKHRTGAMGAVYRFHKYDWDYDRAYKEMKEFKFYTLPWMYKPIKRYVQDYAEGMGKYEKKK